jgi:adenylate cyclase, class 2
MQSEIEAKFVNVDHDVIRGRLETAGAELLQHMRTMRRAIIETAAMRANNGFVRVRDEGDRTTLTYKQFESLSVDGAKEMEVTVSDYETTVALCVAIGLEPSSYQESKRETWRMGDVEIMLDVWPWLDPYIEIEGASVESVKAAASTLGFEWGDAVFGDVMAAYRLQYPHLGEHDTVATLARVTFGDPLPDMLR